MNIDYFFRKITSFFEPRAVKLVGVKLMSSTSSDLDLRVGPLGVLVVGPDYMIN